MKNVFLLFAFCYSALLFSQSDQKPVVAENKWGKYVAFSVSTTNTDSLANGSYFSIEGGFMKRNLSLGLSGGRSTFGNARSVVLPNGQASEEKDLWFVEPKAAFTLLEHDFVRGYVLTGFGAYFLRDDISYFIEYGGGALLAVGKGMDVCIQFSNWDGMNYLSLGLSKSF